MVLIPADAAKFQTSRLRIAEFGMRIEKSEIRNRNSEMGSLLRGQCRIFTGLPLHHLPNNAADDCDYPLTTIHYSLKIFVL